MKNKTFFLAAGLLLAMSLLASACGGTTSSTSDSISVSPPTSESSSAVASENAAASSSESEPETSSESSSETSGDSSSSELRVFTTEELAQYNGKDGQPAYVAVEGVVYDVTDVPQWANGDHNGYEAGQDLTDAIENISPHGTSVLDGLPVVGTLVT